MSSNFFEIEILTFMASHTLTYTTHTPYTNIHFELLKVTYRTFHLKFLNRTSLYTLV